MMSRILSRCKCIARSRNPLDFQSVQHSTSIGSAFPSSSSHRHRSSPTSSGSTRRISKQPNTYKKLCQTSTHLSQQRIYSTENNNSESKVHGTNQMKDDPEVAAWMNQISQDFDSNNRNKDLFTIKDDKNDNQHLLGDTHLSQKQIDKKMNPQLEYDFEDFGYQDENEESEPGHIPERYIPISLNRGQSGVFDIEELVAVLEHENGVDVQVMDVPPEFRFVDHMVVVSGKSLRHMRAMAASLEWLYKRKKNRRDKPFKLEGKDCKDWMATDLGNIAVHIFTPEARAHYDLETLWTLGPEGDDQRHYVVDATLNLSAEELFWLETGANPTDAASQATAPQDAAQQAAVSQDGHSATSPPKSSHSAPSPKDSKY